MVGAKPRRLRRPLRTVALVLIVLAVAFRVVHGSGLKLEKDFPPLTTSTPSCATSKIDVESTASLLTVRTLATIYFTNTGPTCALDPEGPSVAFEHHGTVPFDVGARGSYGPQDGHVVIVHGYTLYAELLLATPKVTSHGACSTFTGRQIVVSQIGVPDGSVVRLPMYAQDVCANGSNLGLYSY